MNTLETLPLSSETQSLLRPSIGLILVGFLIAGVLYSTASVSIAQLIFPKQANGSLIELDGNVVGSSLVGQNFVSEQYFQGRPSAVSYSVDGMAGSNLAISNPDLQKQIKERTAQFAQNNQMTEQQVPNEMVTASGSGIDPDISPESALLQVKRVAQQRHLPEQQVRDLVQQQIQAEQFGIYGQARVNVLQLNLALDQLSSTTR
ncbi:MULTISPECIES: potassium-transporting ATPase subunit KdpC [Acinetobacter]|jgi:K+-transporting ATPase ATPase C chain|uniref:Potassium-transporting ATPase KdpC subunit n=1 Tax=Acinetobacter johnsonii TaxID=40214 RepID=A0AAJ6ICS9_ACIJO|nr:MULTISPECIES: potassium-transporting ATPase subunit KdpC [Acinetobacter]ALV73892.1 potassium-transporting ATPase subunit C [Acinetobacter johnsonii XBB1]MCV2452961.1 potassium-transporting ATPase subunit KdpC [Acinetobacter johnsonii]MDH1241151.1 potassium-transporting ATPase subunit KdpC [Acinetobacter johnsonii]MDH1531708.1 potassium-transporting ATPase subunit KdpC [Acinetobacter johnsonii]QBK68578.1 potassium-transporting ATPase subunit KdpC [Acinetobacter johnsonii]